MHPRIGALAVFVMLPACTATQIRQNTADMADTTVSIQRHQVLHNIGAAISDRSSVPSGIVLGTGQANVSLDFAPAAKATALNGPKPPIDVDVSLTDTWISEWLVLLAAMMPNSAAWPRSALTNWVC
jgi:hypothetical protein